MATFPQFLNSLDADPQIRGDQFEKVFVKWFLKNDPEWSAQVEQVWLFDNWPGRWGRDKGTDLIFKHKNGEIWAVQSKCINPKNYIKKAEIDSFLADSDRPEIHNRLLIASTDLIGPNAKETLDSKNDVVKYLYSDFEKAEVDYPDHISYLRTAKRKNPPTPRPHQFEAIDAVEEGFKNNDRGQLIMACGTGKTYVSLWVKEKIHAQSTLVLVPSLSLLSQTLREWTFAAKEPFDVLCVCSDKTVVKKSDEDDLDDLIESVRDAPFPVTWKVEKIRTFMKSSSPKVIFSTYQSSHLIVDAQSNDTTLSFDLSIVDEAHRCTGDNDGMFTTILDDSQIKSKRRLFATATPKTYNPTFIKRAEERGVKISGMDDKIVFGKVFYSLPFGEAIKRKLLSDYQVVIVGVNKPMIYEWIQNRELIKTEAGEIKNAEYLAAQIGLLKSVKNYDLKRIISFHYRISRAKEFASSIKEATICIPEEHLPKGEIWSEHVSGKMSSHERKIKLQKLKDLSQGDRGLLSNARCLSEGVDVPALDGVGFIDPKGSVIDIVQAVGRAIRRSEDKKIGTIFLPVFLEEEKNAESTIEASKFKPIWRVLMALKSHDDILSFELDQMRTNLGRSKHKSKIGKFSKIFFDLPQEVSESFSESLKTVLVEQTTASWNFWYGLLINFYEKEKHTVVPLRHNEGSYKLGQWVISQRHLKNKLELEKIRKLDALDFVWNTNDQKWEEGFSYLKEYFNQEKQSEVPQNYKTSNNYALGTWVAAQRGKKTLMSPKQIRRLDELNFIWSILDQKWEIGFSYYEKYVQKENHGRVPRGFKIDGYLLGKWVGKQRYKKDRLSPEQIIRLDELSFDWDPFKNVWEKGFLHLEEYFKQKGHSNVPEGFVTADGYNLWAWVCGQRDKKDKLNYDRKSRLDALKFATDPRDALWEKGFSQLKNYYDEKGHCKIPLTFITAEKFKLGGWVNNQRYRKDRLSKKQMSRLVALGFDFNPQDTLWEKGFSHMKNFYDEKGHCRVTQKFETAEKFSLGTWVCRQRQVFKKGNLSSERKSRLDSLGFIWILE